MQTRKKPRKVLDLPGRYFTGLGTPVDVVLSDVSEGGCRFPIGSQKLAIGSPLQIYIAGVGPYRAAIRWVEDGHAGVTFSVPLDPEQVDNFKAEHVSGTSNAATTEAFEPMDDAKPRRFC